MKKITNTIAFAAAVLCAVVSCQKAELINPNENPKVEEGLVFYASLENADTKTTITNEGTAGYKISWETTDSISVNGIVYKAVPDGTNPAKATFTKMRDGDPNPSAPYKAYYPASIYDGTTATLPATQTYTADGSIAAILPMYAEGSSTTNLNFKNLCGLLKFTLKGTETVRYITVSDTSKAICGKFNVTDNSAVLTPDTRRILSLDCGEGGVTLDATTGKDFYVAVPAGSYEHLTIQYNTPGYAKVCDKKASTTAVIERNIVLWTQGEAFRKYEGTKGEKAKVDWRNNLWWRTDGQEDFNGTSFKAWCGRVKDEGSVFADPLFVDWKNHDFTLKEGSPALKLGFKPIDVSAIGRQPR